MIKGLSARSNDLEILFWDCAFHCVKLAQKLEDFTVRVFPGRLLNFRRKLLVFIVLFNTGFILGVLLGYLHNL